MNNTFVQTISNEQLALLPPSHFNGGIVVVDDIGMVDSAYESLKKHTILGFDTETRPVFKAGRTNKVALLQLSTPETCFIFRLSKIKLPEKISDILTDSTIKKIGVDVKCDLAALGKISQLKPQGFIDLQHIASKWGIEDKSLRKLAAIVLGKRISKAQRLSNWEAVSLTEAQKLYAATDAWICLEIYHKLLDTPCR